MERIKGLAKRVIVMIATAMMTVPGMAVGSALASDSPTEKWIKLCRKDEQLKKEVCQTLMELRTPDGQFLARFMVFELAGEARRKARIILPTGMLLSPGLKIQVDQNKAEDAKYFYCAPDGCISELLITDAMFADMKKGKVLSVGAHGQASNPVSFNFSLDTFKSSNEGKPLDEAEIQKLNKQIEEEIISKRKSLEEQLKDAQHKAQQSE
jgi:invasion protein IalB